MNKEIYTFTVDDIDHQSTSLSDFKDQILLIVNTASQCGLTPQYEGLEKLYSTYKGEGFAVLGFPCDQFMHQEPGNEADIKEFCSINYKISFPLFSKVKVNGPEAIPLYNYLKNAAPGALNSKGIKWNFTKFLVNQHGDVVKRYAPTTKPETIASDISLLIN